MDNWCVHFLETLKIAFLLNILLCILIKTGNSKIIVRLPPLHNSVKAKSGNLVPYSSKTGDTTSLEYIYHTTCTYNGVTYATGEFHLSKCVLCTCNGTSGQVKCTANSCPEVKNCVRYDSNLTTDCCPRCVEYGCFHNGSYYKAGERIGNDNCRKCFCPWKAREEGGADIKCLTIQCHQPGCVDNVVPRGKCCSICPNGKCTAYL